ncbi:MAG: hypothetical protein PF440_04290 [Thiomicrorhabdus sp.]|jgi:hypothetical protein|nr:hypothetical protein [Thiomicrorhabdus sp.]
MNKQFTVVYADLNGKQFTTVHDAVSMANSYDVTKKNLNMTGCNVVSITEKVSMSPFKVIMVKTLENGIEKPVKVRVFANDHADANVRALMLEPTLRVFSITKMKD